MFITVVDATFAVVKRKLVQDKSTRSNSSFHGFVMNQFNDLPLVGLLAQMVEHCTGIFDVKF